MSENPFGPLSAEEFQKAVDAPYGRAGDILRKADPLWGRSFPDGVKSRWKVTFRQQVTMQAIKYVEAGSEEEAEAIAETIPDNELTFDQYVDADDSELVSAVEAP